MAKLSSRERANTYNSLDDIHIVRHNKSYKMRTSLIPQGTGGESIVGNFYDTGGVIHLQDLDYNCWVNGFTINNVAYSNSLTRNLTLNVGDATHPRKDIFAIDVSGATPDIIVVEGTPAATPLEPSLDLTTQVKLGLREVPANATTDPTASHEVIYDENTEWTNDYAQSGSDLDYTVDSFTGSKNIKTVATTEDYFQWTKGNTETYSSEGDFIFALKNISIFTNQDFRIQLKLINSSSNDYWLVNLPVSELAKRGYISETIDSWQLVQIPLSDFQGSSKSETEYDRLEFRFFDAPVFNIDWINVQSGIEPTPTGVKFIDLSDTPNNYYGQSGKVATVKTDETGLEFTTPSSGGTSLTGYTVVTLPSGNIGDLAYVTDAVSWNGFNINPTGGGSVVAPVFYNGTDWKLM